MATLKELKQILESKKSYLKKGKKWLSDYFDCSEHIVEQALNEIKGTNKKNKPPTNKDKIINILEQQVSSLNEYSNITIKSKKDSEKSNYGQGIHIVLSCVHVPFHNEQLIKALGSFIEDYKEDIKGFHLIGDFLDMRSLSFHEKGTIPLMGVTLGYEYSKGNEVLDYLDTVLPKDVYKNFLWGNHEDRYKRLGKITDVSKYIDALPSPTQALKLKERGYRVKENWQEDYIQLGKIQLIHGIFCNSTPAKKHLNSMKTSVMFGHSHRIDSYYENDSAAFNIGCFIDIDAEGFKYISRVERMNWKNGFGLIHLDKDGTFQADIIHCLNNSFFYGGKKY